MLHGILHRWPHLRGQGSRPGIVHRLDKPTEGLLLIGLNPDVQWKLSRQFQNREVDKRYVAYLLSTPSEMEGRLEFPLMRDRVDRRKRTVHPAGRDATTIYQVTDVYKTRKGRKLCRVEIELITGRTHQIRVHAKLIECPIVGDNLYQLRRKEDLGVKKTILPLLDGKRSRQMLHAHELSLVHPESGETTFFKGILPLDFSNLLLKLGRYKTS